MKQRPTVEDRLAVAVNAALVGLIEPTDESVSISVTNGETVTLTVGFLCDGGAGPDDRRRRRLSDALAGAVPPEVEVELAVVEHTVDSLELRRFYSWRLVHDRWAPQRQGPGGVHWRDRRDYLAELVPVALEALRGEIPPNVKFVEVNGDAIERSLDLYVALDPGTSHGAQRQERVSGRFRDGTGGTVDLRWDVRAGDDIMTWFRGREPMWNIRLYGRWEPDDLDDDGEDGRG